MATGKYELYKTASGKFRFRLKAANGENILSSESYASRSGAVNGIKSVRTNGGNDARFERKQSSNDKHYFVLKSGNHQVIGKSQMYATQKSCEGGINSIKKNSGSERVDDLAAKK